VTTLQSKQRYLGLALAAVAQSWSVIDAAAFGVSWDAVARSEIGNALVRPGSITPAAESDGIDDVGGRWDFGFTIEIQLLRRTTPEQAMAALSGFLARDLNPRSRAIQIQFAAMVTAETIPANTLTSPTIVADFLPPLYDSEAPEAPAMMIDVTLTACAAL